VLRSDWVNMWQCVFMSMASGREWFRCWRNYVVGSRIRSFTCLSEQYLWLSTAVEIVSFKSTLLHSLAVLSPENGSRYPLARSMGRSGRSGSRGEGKILVCTGNRRPVSIVRLDGPKVWMQNQDYVRSFLMQQHPQHFLLENKAVWSFKFQITVSYIKKILLFIGTDMVTFDQT
jgi:hypothetical protein